MSDLPDRISTVRPDVLAMALDAAVPLWMVRLSMMTRAERLKLAQADALVIAEHVDVLNPECVMELSQDVFSALARGIAFGALNGGVVDPFGRHWCAGEQCGSEPAGSSESEPLGA